MAKKPPLQKTSGRPAYEARRLLKSTRVPNARAQARRDACTVVHTIRELRDDA